MKYKIGNVEVEACQFKGIHFKEMFDFCKRHYRHRDFILDLQGNDYMISSKGSLFILSEQDFNNMATKVKEPKFKVGDKVYYFEEDDINLDFGCVVISNIHGEGEYLVNTDTSTIYYEEELLTLEEAIEKLKDL